MSCVNHVEVEEALRPCARCAREFCGDCTIVVRGRVLCADCKDDDLRDYLSGVGVANAGLPLADIRLRAAAWLIDYLCYIALWFALPRLMPGIFWVFGVWAIYVVYEALALTYFGKTLGKALVQIKVVRADGAPLGAGRAWLRAGIRGIFVSILSVIDYAPALLTAQRTCIHDLVAGTRVVKVDSR